MCVMIVVELIMVSTRTLICKRYANLCDVKVFSCVSKLVRSRWGLFDGGEGGGGTSCGRAPPETANVRAGVGHKSAVEPPLRPPPPPPPSTPRGPSPRSACGRRSCHGHTTPKARAQPHAKARTLVVPTLLTSFESLMYRTLCAICTFFEY